ncbi:hypothetical protein ACQKGD_10055 [Peribacillus frigoritolerans]|uniref:hypothetical protein n=1 Tax=Peribacillus frigoritolerans TaxID=450367 RepID=UPI002079FF1F|nr:hypothetical protein [Peribacillus frigoritolerans]USK62837.1 hypothetical protein LIT26_16355 [Peribacillus frigoritolerans]
MKNNPKNFSVKIIRGFAYIYSWSYRKKNYRSNTVPQRYHWKYRGRYGTKRVQDFMKQLNNEKQQQLKKQVQKKLKVYEETQKQINVLIEEEPFKTKYNEVTKIKNRVVREERLRQLRRELNLIINNKKKNIK